MSKTTTNSKQKSSNGKSAYARVSANGNGSLNSSSSSNSSSSKSTAREEKTLDDLFKDELKDIYSAEKQLLEALPKLAKAADNEELADAFSNHLQQTQKHVERLEKLFDRLGIDKDETEECEAMKGLIEEGEELLEKFKSGPVRDAALIIAAQKVEHYEIASYGSLRELADALGYHRECDILDRTLQEEGDTDHLLTEIAMDVNDEACELENSSKEEYSRH